MSNISSLKNKKIDEPHKLNKPKNKFDKNKSTRLLLLSRNQLFKLNKNKTSNYFRHKKTPKKSKSIQDFSNNNKSIIDFTHLGPYNNLFNGGGGFCTKIQGRNINHSYKNKRHSKKCLSRNISTNKYDLNHKNSSNSMKTINNNSINKTINFENKKKFEKININEVYKNIIYFKLNKDDLDNNNNYIEKKDEVHQQKKNTIKNVHKENNNSFDNININNNALYNNYCFPNNKHLIKQNNEQFSMKNSKIRKFNKLSIDTILLSYFPSFNDIQRNKKNKNDNLKNFTITTSHFEYKIIKNPKLSCSSEENKIKKIQSTNNREIINDIPNIKDNVPLNAEKNGNDNDIINNIGIINENEKNMKTKKEIKHLTKTKTKIMKNFRGELLINNEKINISSKNSKMKFKHMKNLNIKDNNKQKV